MAFGQTNGKAPKHLTVYEKNIQDFSFHDLHLGSTFQDFTNTFSSYGHEVSNSNDAIGNEIYEVDNIDNISVALFYFFDGTLYQIRLGYANDLLNSIGGADILLDKLFKKYGVASKVTPDAPDSIYGEVYWYFDNDRTVYANSSKDLFYVAFIYVSLMDKMEKALHDSDSVGF